jgi:MATE family multidrug resistance protein
MTPQRSSDWGAEIRATLGLGLPLIGSHVAQIATHLVDTLMLGWYGIEALAAGVLGSTMFFVTFIVGSGFAMAVMPMAASAEGAGERAQVRRVVRMGLWISVLYGAVMVWPLWFARPILIGLGQNPETAALAQDYLRIAAWGMFPALGIMVLKSFLSALERPRVFLWVTALAALGNGLLNWALIFGNWGAPEMGVRGAALASVITQALALGALVLWSARGAEFRRYTLFVRFWRSDRAAFAQVFRLGWPIGITMLAEVGMFSAAALMMGWIGTGALAAHGIAIQIASLTFMVHLGLANAATVRAGRALGRRDGAALRRGAAAVIALSLGFVAVTILLFVTVPGTLIGLFLNAADPQAAAIVAIGVPLLYVAALFQLADAMQVIGLGLLRGLHDTSVPMVLAAVSYWGVGLPAAWLLGIRAGWEGPGVWAGLVVGLALAAVTLFWRLRSRIRLAAAG